MLLKVTMEWESDRVTYFIVYAPDSSYDDATVEYIFGTLQDEMNLLPPTDKIVVLGDFNSSVGNTMHDNWSGVVGHYAVVTIVITTQGRLNTWFSQDRTEKKIDYIIM